MTMKQWVLMPVLALALLASACSKGGDDIYQGWIEGDFIFVSPDEQGRIETMMVRQGDQVKTGQLMFTLDQELQAADLGVAEATLANAKQAFDRAQQLMKSGSGTQKDFDFTQALFREAQARLAAAQTRLMRRKVLSPVNGLIQTVYFRPGETVPPGRAIVSILPPGNVKLRFFVPEPMLARIAIDDAVRFRLRRLSGRSYRKDQLHFAVCRIHPAGHLFAAGAPQAGLSRSKQCRPILRRCASVSRSTWW